MDESDHHTGDRGGSGGAGPPATGEQTTAPARRTTTAIGGHSDTATVVEPTRLTAVERLDEITGVGQRAAQTIIAEIGLDMARFPTPEHLVSWAKLCPRTIQSGPVIRGGKTGKGNPYLKGALGEAAAAARTDTFLGERYRRLVNAAAGSKLSSRSPAPSWSSFGSCFPTPPPDFTTSAPTTTPAAWSPSERSATTSPT